MIHYVNGFIFNQDCTGVVLLKKTHPDWQAGFLNGVGGKVEEREYFEDAMKRESLEEVGVTGEWEYFISMKTTTWAVHFFAVQDQLAYQFATSKTEEEVTRILVKNIQEEKTLPCLKFLIPLARYKLTMKFSDPEHLVVGAHDDRRA